MTKKPTASESFEKFIKTMHRLRAPDGCMWDRAQTHETLIKCLKEESQEVIDAIKNKDDENLQEELGDLLLQVVFHAKIAEEEDRFTLSDVIEGVNQKLIRRHPHVFGAVKADTPEQALEQWKAAKTQEKAVKTMRAKKTGKNEA
jgi:MazG family protein